MISVWYLLSISQMIHHPLHQSDSSSVDLNYCLSTHIAQQVGLYQEIIFGKLLSVHKVLKVQGTLQITSHYSVCYEKIYQF